MKNKQISPAVRVHEGFEALLLLAVMFAALSWINSSPRPVSFEQLLGVSLKLRYVLIAVISALIWHLFLQLAGVYRTAQYHSIARASFGVTVAAIGAGLTVFVLLALGEPSLAHYKWLTTVFGFTAALCLLVRIAGIVAMDAAPMVEKRVLIVGTGALAQTLLHQLQLHEDGVARNVIGFVGAPPEEELRHEINVLGTLAELESLLMGEAVDEVYIGLALKDSLPEVEQALATCEEMGIECRFPSDLLCKGGNTGIAWHGGKPFVARRAVNMEAHEVLAKRAFDIVISLTAVLVFLPIMAAVAVAIRLSSKGPALFCQERFGLNRRAFKMLKFRTMVVDAEARQASLETSNEASGPVFKMKLDPRITPLGRVLRKTSLDELPQLFNILWGDMSLVGPRPLPRRDVSRFNDSWLMRRFSVKPGLTCLWQIGGRSNTSFDYWIAQDLEYIDTWSLRLDLEILMRTVPAVVRGSGAM